MRRTAALSLILLIAIMIALVALVFLRQNFDENPRAQELAVKKLGAVLPLTGDTASYGLAAKTGIELAVEEVNLGGGAAGGPIEVIFEDDQGLTSRALSGMQKLATVDRVPLVFGAAASSITLALCPVANESKVVLITPISSSQELTSKCGPFFFRVCPSDVLQARMMADWMEKEGRRDVGVIYVNNSWGQGLRAEFRSRFREIGGRIAAEEAIKEGDRDVRGQLTKVAAAHPDSLYAITYGKEGGALLRQARELGLNLPIYGADVWGSPELIQTAGDAAQGVKIIIPAKLDGPNYQKFAASYRKKFGTEPDIYSAYAYDMAKLVALALSKADRGEDLRKALASTFYEGVTGIIEFDNNGDVTGKGFERKVL